MTDALLPPVRQRELTWRALLLGGALTFVFTAANVYFGLRVGLTFSTALPAAITALLWFAYSRTRAGTQRIGSPTGYFRRVARYPGRGAGRVP